MEDKKINKIDQLQEAIENETINQELKEYVSRLQEKLRKVRSFGGNFREVDFSPYMNDVINSIDNSSSHPGTEVQEVKQRSDRGKKSTLRI